MYLKALEIVGFKSFAEKVRFDLQRGITCIVGPNGCGKSNVVDSIRWCIGEMSWKSLRSASMVDIIFNGSSKRTPLGMAEVNMVFDNESRKLSLDFPEITVTRRVFRSGESEYFLNKVQCRLRDIRDMFLDTGIGGEGYAIIDQGGVEFVLSATPETRRELFEEAAGVSKYKAKRDEAQKRLEKVDYDLARLMDSVVLIDEQLKKLDSEARKAKLYQKYREELKEAEIAQSLEIITSAETEIGKNRAELEPLLQQITDKTTAISVLEGEIAALNLNLTHKQAELSQHNEKISSAKYQMGLLEGNIANCGNLTAELEKQIASSKEEDAMSARRREELAAAAEKLKAQLDALGQEINPVQSKYEAELGRLNLLDKEMQSLSQTLDKANSDLMNAAQAEIQLANKTALEQSGLTHDQEKLINLEKENQKISAQKQQLQQETAELAAALSQHKANLETIQSKLNSSMITKTELAAKVSDLSASLSAVKSTVAAANATFEVIKSQGSKDPYWVGAQAVTNAGIEGVAGTLRHHLSIPEENRIYVEEALGRFLDSVICESFDCANRAIELLKSNGTGRCRFIILNAVPAFAENPAGDSATSLKSRMEYPNELENLINHLLAECAVEGASVRGKYWISGGAEKVESPEPYWGKEEELRAQLGDARKEEAAITSELAAAQAELAAIETALNELRASVNSEMLKENTAAHTLSAKTQDLQILDETLGIISGDKAKIAGNKEIRQKTLEELNLKLSALREQQGTIKSDIEQLKIRKTNLETDTYAAKQELERVNAQLYELRIRRGSLEADSKGVTLEHNNLGEAAARRESQRQEAANRVAQLAEQKLSAQAQLSALRDNLAELELGEAKLKEDLTALRGEFELKSKSANTAKSETAELQMTAHDLETKINGLQSQKDEAARNLSDTWQITPEEARHKYSEVEVDHERVKMMRRRLENMGAVNMTAPEEYDALTARNQFLRSQITDLEQAKEDLKTAISKINATTRENFRHTFDSVRTHFQRIYQTLFVGGEADLIMTQPDNLLETGVEIVAQPPGKKLQSISALSGGEKALTAMALLFSFFCVNPSPFCIMDEADAPLDEANVERFVGLLKEFTSQTQFLVITHNKRTMESANILYGVTMEESGISKIMSVSLNKENGGKEPLELEMTKAPA